MRLNGSPEVIFSTDDDRSYFLAVLPIHPDFLTHEQVGEQVLAILEYCTEQRSKLEILTYQGLKPVFLNYKRHIMPLVGYRTFRDDYSGQTAQQQAKVPDNRQGILTVAEIQKVITD